MTEDREGVDGLRRTTIDRLCEAFAEDRITVEEFESRVERAHGASDVQELEGVLAGLPAPPTGRDPEATPPSAPSAGDGSRAGLPSAVRAHSLPPIARPEEVPARAFLCGCFGGASRRGRWIPARTTFLVGMLGGVKVDLRDAIFPAGVTEIRVLALMGGAEILVPPGVRIESSGMGVMGGFDVRSTVAPTDDPDAPVVRITGFAMMGGIDVRVLYPGESKRDARRRRRAEKKMLKRSNR